MSNSIRQIVFGYGDVNGIITPLIPFNCVYDIDFGLIRFMYENGYNSNTNLVDQNFFALFKNDTRKVVAKLYSRTNENPLSLCIKEKPDYSANITVNIDDLYVEFMTKYYEKIIRSSVHTGLYEVLPTFATEKSIKASIIYTTESEYYMLKDDPNLKDIELIDLEYVHKRLSEFNLIFFKSLDDMYIELMAKSIHSKSIYIMDYGYNFDNGVLRDTIYKEVLEINRNTINIINAYDRSRLGLEE